MCCLRKHCTARRRTWSLACRHASASNAAAAGDRAAGPASSPSLLVLMPARPPVLAGIAPDPWPLMAAGAVVPPLGVVAAPLPPCAAGILAAGVLGFVLCPCRRWRPAYPAQVRPQGWSARSRWRSSWPRTARSKGAVASTHACSSLPVPADPAHRASYLAYAESVLSRPLPAASKCEQHERRIRVNRFPDRVNMARMALRRAGRTRMETYPRPPGAHALIFVFDDFELDITALEQRRAGAQIKADAQVLRLLSVLVRRRAELRTAKAGPLSIGSVVLPTSNAAQPARLECSLSREGWVWIVKQATAQESPRVTSSLDDWKRRLSCSEPQFRSARVECSGWTAAVDAFDEVVAEWGG